MNSQDQDVTEKYGPNGTVEPQRVISRAPSPSRAQMLEWLRAPSHVYFIYSAGRVKIGFSANWPARVDAVKQGCAHQAELVLLMPGDRQMERGYHALFGDYHETGEWFRCEGKMREFLMRFSSPEGQETLQLAEEAFQEISA